MCQQRRRAPSRGGDSIDDGSTIVSPGLNVSLLACPPDRAAKARPGATRLPQPRRPGISCIAEASPRIGSRGRRGCIFYRMLSRRLRPSCFRRTSAGCAYVGGVRCPAQGPRVWPAWSRPAGGASVEGVSVPTSSSAAGVARAYGPVPICLPTRSLSGHFIGEVCQMCTQECRAPRVVESHITESVRIIYEIFLSIYI